MPTPVKVTSVKRIKRTATVCDITVADNHNLFVCKEISNVSVLAHNCARDTPTICKAVGAVVSAETKQRIWKTIKRYDNQYEVYLHLETHEELDYLVTTKPCKDHKYYKKHLEGFDPCPLAPVCFSDKLQPLLDMTMQEYIDQNVKTVKR